jgi:hypothetical protein
MSWLSDVQYKLEGQEMFGLWKLFLNHILRDCEFKTALKPFWDYIHDGGHSDEVVDTFLTDVLFVEIEKTLFSFLKDEDISVQPHNCVEVFESEFLPGILQYFCLLTIFSLAVNSSKKSMIQMWTWQNQSV